MDLKSLERGGGLLAAGLLAMAAILAGAGSVAAQQDASIAPAPAAIYAEQGWQPADRDTFYTTGQGSRIMPYAWFMALQRVDGGEPFADDQLQRYGYLNNDSPRNTAKLPIGFVVDPVSNNVGMTCAACHTSELDFRKPDGALFRLRIDGAPAKADFQRFLTDLSSAAEATLNEPRFDAFARQVLGPRYSSTSARDLRAALTAWVAQFGNFMDSSLPADHPWGPGRLDAFGMIFNRVAARDLQVSANFATADAPVRYPFLWNAPRQDATQWTGVVPNGRYILGLARNTGEVMGVFAAFNPTVSFRGNQIVPTAIGFGDNSVDFAGLETLEEELWTLKPPAWPSGVFGFSPSLAAVGQPLFQTYCSSCHSEQPSNKVAGAWMTPVVAAGTDPRTAVNGARPSATGLYFNSLILRTQLARFGDQAATTDILQTSVVGALLNDAAPLNPNSGVWRALRKDQSAMAPGLALSSAIATNSIQDSLAHIYASPQQAASGAAYEARVLCGVWAAAPYLHNGSVPNLMELLTPPDQRRTMQLVPNLLFDPVNVGYATVPSPPQGGGPFAVAFASPVGDSNAGHDYGTHLNLNQRLALIEYVKSLGGGSCPS